MLQCLKKKLINNKRVVKVMVLLATILFFIGLFPNMINAQPVWVRAYTDKSKVLLGEPLWLILETKTLKVAQVPTFSIDSISHFEFIVKDSFTVLQTGDTTVYRQYYQLASFDSGRWVIPPFTLRPYVKTNSVLVDVVFTENFDPKQPYHDVKPIVNVSFKISATFEKWWYWIAAILILITLLIYRLTIKKERKQMPAKHIAENAYKKALRSLDEIKRNNADAKIFYKQLVDIFRTYILERAGISSLQQTSNNLIEKIKPLMADDAKYNNISKVLFLCDLVKFAKYDPDKAEASSAFEVVKDCVGYIETKF